MAKHRNSIDSLIANRIRDRGDGWVFAPADFADIGSRTAVATAVARQKSAGSIRQLARGICDNPRRHRRLGLRPPPIDSIVDAIRARDAVRVQPTGANAAILLGLSTQVPARPIFVTDGPVRRTKVGTIEIAFKYTTPLNMATAGGVSGSVIQALRWLGKNAVYANVVRHLRRARDDGAKRELLEDARHAPAWVAEVIRDVCASDATSSGGTGSRGERRNGR